MIRDGNIATRKAGVSANHVTERILACVSGTQGFPASVGNLTIEPG
ncbi:MAG: hypothetical protein QOI66_4600 [Myxococcales bacterium]|nr:hypothetical protein [Myxococcales bacterium]